MTILKRCYNPRAPHRPSSEKAYALCEQTVCSTVQLHMLNTVVRATTGGGRKVIRCEVSLDGGDSWRLAEIERHEKPTPYNKFWCWVFWSIPIPTVDLLRSTEVRVRAVDSSNNMMPEKCASAHL